MENYIVINGKKVELTEEQLKQLGIEVKKTNPYERAQKNGIKYYREEGYPDRHIKMEYESHMEFDDEKWEDGNYCTDKDLAEQDMLHDLLNRKLRQFSNLNGGIDLNSSDIKKAWEDGYIRKYYIFKDGGSFENYYHTTLKHLGIIYFISEEIAERAIEEIIKPFIKEHQEFVW